MKILLISTTVQPLGLERYGGIEDDVKNFCEPLLKLGYEVTIAAPVGSKVPAGAELIETVRLPVYQDRDDISFYIWQDRISEFDCIHDFSHQKVLARERENAPVINMVWNLNPRGPPLPKYNLMCLSLYHGQLVADFTGQTVKQEYLGIDLEKFRPLDCERTHFLYCANIVLQKGVLEAIKYCKELGERLYICGGTPNREFSWQVMEKCDDENVVWVGNVLDRVKVDLIQHSKAVLCPLHSQHALEMAFSKITVESLACGVPVIAPKLGVFLELFEDGKHGFHAITDEEYKAAMRKVSEIDPKDCRELAESRYDREKIVRYVKELYEPVRDGLRWA